MFRVNRKKYIYIFASLLGLFIFYLFIAYIGREEIRYKQMLDKLGKNEFAFGIYKEEKVQNRGPYKTQEIYIKGWLNDKNDAYYLFIPKEIDTKQGLEWRYVFNQYEEIQIDGNVVSGGNKFALEDGTYTLQFGENKKKLIVLSSGDIATLFVELDNKNLNEITESKENSATGVYYLSDEVTKEFQSVGIIEDIHARGNLSFTETDKKSFSMEIAEEDSLSNMDKSDKWLLIANSFDSTLSRNHIADKIAKNIEMPYIPEARYIDLYIDGEYQGNYQLCEKVEITDGRVDIRDLEEETEKINVVDLVTEDRTDIIDEDEIIWRKYVDIEFEPSDITSGYLLELDMYHRYKKEVSGFLSTRKQPVIIKSPEYAGEHQVNFVADKYQGMEDALCSENGYNLETGLYYYEYIDMDSFAKKYLVDEVTKNTDSSLSSFFIYIPEYDNRFYAGPIWDYDKALGANEVRDIYFMSDPEGFYASENIELEVCAGKEFSIYYMLCQQKEFSEVYKKIYFDELRDDLEDIYEYEISKNAEKIEKSAIMNAVRWNVYGDENDLAEIRKNFLQDNSDMAVFLKNRVAFLDEEWSK